MERRAFQLTVAASVLLVGCFAAGFAWPGSLNWGFNLFGFLPAYVFVLYILLVAAVFVLVLRGPLLATVQQAAQFMENSTGKFLGVVGIIYLICAIAFRVKASVLGDSFTLIYNFLDYASGASVLAPWHEPLSIYALYYAVTALGPLSYPQIFTSFLITEIILGAAFILVAYYTVRNTITSPVNRFLLFLLLMVMPYMEFYFGYIEVYSVSQLLLALFVLCSLLVLNEKLTFSVLPTVWLLLVLSHFINGALGLSLAYLAWRSWRRGEKTRVVIGIGAACLVLLAVFILAHFELERVMNVSPVSHFLSVTWNISEINAYSQAYTLFSPYHLLEILNYFILMSPFCMILVLLGLYYLRRGLGGDPVMVWFLAALVPVLAAMGTTKLEQGFASDWDVFASHFFLIALTCGYMFLREEHPTTLRTFALVIGMTLLSSLGYFEVNAMKEPSIQRFESLWDSRILSHLGNYTHVLRLTRYYESQNDTLPQIDIWQRYSLLYPQDPRGYSNQIQLLSTYTPEDDRSKAAAYERWMRVDATSDSLRKAYAAFCVNAGNRYFAASNFAAARSYYGKAIANDTTGATAYNNMGSVLAEQGALDTAVAFFRKAVSIDTAYADAYYNLGSASIDLGRAAEGRTYLEKAARLGNTRAQEALKTAPEKTLHMKR